MDEKWNGMKKKKRSQFLLSKIKNEGIEVEISLNCKGKM